MRSMTGESSRRDNNLYAVCKYVGLGSHQWAGYNMLANQAFWNQLPESIRQVVIRNTKKYFTNSVPSCRR
jgi:TRAP-type C4-dicarboxylate transport system substrate-binding protein